MVEPTTGKVIKLGDEMWTISRDGSPVQLVDLISEARQINGIVYLSFLQTVIDAGAVPEAHVAARLRMNLVTAQGLHSLLGSMIEDAFKKPDKAATN